MDEHTYAPLLLEGAVNLPEDEVEFATKNALEDGVLSALLPIEPNNLGLVSVNIGLRHTILIGQHLGATSLLEQARAAGLPIPEHKTAEDILELVGGPEVGNLAAEFNHGMSEKQVVKAHFEGQTYEVESDKLLWE